MGALPYCGLGPGGDKGVAVADPTGFEPAISSVTGTYVRPLHHGSRNAIMRSAIVPVKADPDGTVMWLRRLDSNQGHPR